MGCQEASNREASRQSFLHHGGVSGSHTVVGNIAYHHRTGCDDAPPANGDAGTNHHATAQPRVVANGYRESRLLWLSSLPIVDGMLGCKELAMRPNLNVMADGDESFVEHHATIIDERMFAHADAMPVIAGERRSNLRRGG